MDAELYEISMVFPNGMFETHGETQVAGRRADVGRPHSLTSTVTVHRRDDIGDARANESVRLGRTVLGAPD